ncbi:hypothetical protein AXI59_05215 [Bacillus nakamurai]|uniref:hypothetical protein n=1 Tax=Bacillus nakamurai TaxID=1793963 RepID=UPI0007787BC6|nr:hypothetical protein [Bacillus nakamurai]KXZ13577.1 hypothetical protein AXI59_05215 [Bacillus nakamurai]MCC9021400.1 hypothetical protein [Bacillus nakamurai]MCP6682922.1 hypothetical protein [Bacillus nakamurai]
MDIFSKMMFGNTEDRDEPEKEKEKEKEKEEPEADPEEAIDYNHVMNQLGSIMNSLDQLKPVFKDLGSMVSALKKKIM